MADATLNDVIARLRSDNEKQLREQGDTTKAIENLSGTIRGFLEYLELQGLRQQEAEAEARRRATAEANRASASAARSEGLTLGFGAGLFGGIIGTLTSAIGNIAAFATGLVLATEGLGPSLANFRFFVKSIAETFFKPLSIAAANLKTDFGISGSIGAYLSKQITAIDDFFSQRYTFNETAKRYQRLSEFGGTGFVSEKDVSAYQKTLIELNRLFTRIGSLFDSIKIPDRIITSISNTGTRLREILGLGARGARGVATSIAASPVIQGIFKFLRPIAVIFSLFDGLGNATKEMEEREGFFNKYLGGAVGGFIGGTLGSFFGEFANLLRDLPLWVIKQFVPATWLNADGTFKRGEDGGNWFTSLLAGVADIDFARLIREIIKAPFDAAGGALDYVRNLVGATGTTEENQRKARVAWTLWWSNWKSARGIVENIGGIFGVIANIVLSPVNAVLAELERAISGDENIVPVGETFTQKITRYVTQLGDFIFNLLPSIDDIKASIARSAGPGYIVDFLGLNSYLPIASTSDAEKILRGSFEKLNDVITRATNLQGNLANVGNDDNAASFIENQLEVARREFEDAKAEAAAILATARGSAGVNQTVVNNFAQQIETFQFPNNGTVDNSDLIRR